MMVGVAPFTPHAPCATRTRTSFGVRGMTVSSASAGSDSHSVPSAEADKMRLPLGRTVPQVWGSRTLFLPNSPSTYVRAAPTDYPTDALRVLRPNVLDSPASGRRVTPAALSFF